MSAGERTIKDCYSSKRKQQPELAYRLIFKQFKRNHCAVCRPPEIVRGNDRNLT